MSPIRRHGEPHPGEPAPPPPRRTVLPRRPVTPPPPEPAPPRRHHRPNHDQPLNPGNPGHAR